MAFPELDAQLLPYATNFNARLVADGVAGYRLTPALVASFTAVFLRYQDAVAQLQAARETGTFSQSLTRLRDQTRDAMLRVGRGAYANVQSSADVSDADKVLLGVTIREARRTRRPAPSSRPVVMIEGSVGRNVFGRVLDEVSSRSRKPKDVSGAMVWVAVGSQPPATSNEWIGKGFVTRTKLQVDVGDLLTDAAATVWVTAAWVGTRGQQGPASTPVSVNLPAASAMPVVNQAVARRLKIAA